MIAEKELKLICEGKYQCIVIKLVVLGLMLEEIEGLSTERETSIYIE